MKVYKVPLYKVNYFPLSYGEVSYVEDVLVKKNIIGVSEILTGYSKIDIISRGSVEKGRLEFFYLKPDRYRNFGYHLFIYSDSLVSKNRAIESEVDDYLSNYDESAWKEIYDNMKIMTSKQKDKVNQKVRTVFGTKK